MTLSECERDLASCEHLSTLVFVCVTLSERPMSGDRMVWRSKDERHAAGMKCGVPGIIFVMPHDLFGGLGSECGGQESHRARKQFRGSKTLTLSEAYFYPTVP